MLCALATSVHGQNPRGSSEGPTRAAGYDHPDQFLAMKDVKPADKMYPAVPHPEQEAQARQKLAALEGRTGKKPNILIFLLDVPKTTYIDGIDQTGMLLADNGESARRSRPYTLNQYFAMIRIGEFKYIWTAEIQGGFFQKGDVGGSSGPIATETGGGFMVNLYTKPEEDASVGVRHIPATVPVMAAAGEYMKDLIKYRQPDNKKGGKKKPKS